MHSFHYFIISKPINSIKNLQPKWSQCDKPRSSSNDKNVNITHLSKMHFSFASPEFSLMERHILQPPLSPQVRLVFCFFVCLFASSGPPVSEPVCPRARTPCNRVVSWSNKGISWANKKGKQFVIMMACKVCIVVFFRIIHSQANTIYCINRTSTTSKKMSENGSNSLERKQTKLTGTADNQN